MCDVGEPRSARSAATAAEVADADSGCSSDAANAKVSEPVSRSSTTSAWGRCAKSHACTCMRVCGVHLDPEVPRQLKN